LLLIPICEGSDLEYISGVIPQESTGNLLESLFVHKWTSWNRSGNREVLKVELPDIEKDIKKIFNQL